MWLVKRVKNVLASTNNLAYSTNNSWHTQLSLLSNFVTTQTSLICEISTMKIKYELNDVLPYTIMCNVCDSRFYRMSDWEEHEPTHDVEDPDALQAPLVFNFGTSGGFCIAAT